MSFSIWFLFIVAGPKIPTRCISHISAIDNGNHYRKICYLVVGADNLIGRIQRAGASPIMIQK